MSRWKKNDNKTISVVWKKKKENFMGLFSAGALSSKHSFRLVNINLLEQQPAFFYMLNINKE